MSDVIRCMIEVTRAQAHLAACQTEARATFCEDDDYYDEDSEKPKVKCPMPDNKSGFRHYLGQCWTDAHGPYPAGWQERLAALAAAGRLSSALYRLECARRREERERGDRGCAAGAFQAGAVGDDQRPTGQRSQKRRGAGRPARPADLHQSSSQGRLGYDG
jgi:hypothetical protein